MKAIIQIQLKLLHNEELESFSDNLLNIKIYGNTLISHYLDLLKELEVSEIYVFSEEIKTELSSYYLSELYSPKIIFVEWFSADEFYLQKKELFRNDKLLIIKNIGHILTPFDDIKNTINNEEDFVSSDNEFSITFIKNHNKDLKDIEQKEDILDIKGLQGLNDYIYIIDKKLTNIEELNKTVGYVNDDGVIFGKNVEINANVKFIAPVVIQDNVYINKNCTIGPNVVIQDDIFIENDTTISNSIIFDNTYIGSNLSFDNKLIVGDTIINKTTLDSFSIDNRLTSRNN